MLSEAVVLKFVPAIVTAVPMDPDVGVKEVIVGCPTTTEIKQSVNRILLRIHHPFAKALDLYGVIIRVYQFTDCIKGKG